LPHFPPFSLLEEAKAKVLTKEKDYFKYNNKTTKE
jgi:hypothetical protein